jgi:hypothetical protein
MNAFTAIVFVLGSALVTAGAALIYRPAGLMVAGALFLGLAFASARSTKRTTS